MFRYRKLYADLVTESGVVCVVYVAELELLGARSASAGYECYTPDGRRDVVRARSAAHVEVEPNRIAVGFDTPAGPFRYELQRSFQSLGEHQPSPQLSWQVLAATSPARVTGVVGERELSGFGYSDRVELGAPPRTLGLAALAWGRGRTQNFSFVFTEARFRNERLFRCGFVNGTPSCDFTLEPEGRANGALELAFTAQRFQLEDERCLHHGDAVDEARFPGFFERTVSRALSGAIHERRALARVHGPSGETGHALYEQVHFGAH